MKRKHSPKFLEQRRIAEMHARSARQMAFHNLRNVIPTLPSDRTTIKATLRLAIKYIMFLEYVLENNLYCNDFHHEFYQWRETFGK